MQPKIYQENVIEDLLEKAKRLLGYSNNKKLVFKSPTGSGQMAVSLDLFGLHEIGY